MVNSFSHHHVTGRDIEHIQLNQLGSIPSFPLLIPTKTHNLRVDHSLEIDWVGIEIDRILSLFNKLPRMPQKSSLTPKAFRELAQVGERTKVIVVLNGVDSKLEKFWGMDRLQLYEMMEKSSVNAVTGPTFSIYDQTTGGYPMAESHRVTMMRRHFRVIQELSDNEFFTIPNVYFRNQYDIDRWINWLKGNKSIKVLSRDLTCTRSGKEFESYLQQLIELIKGTHRSFHVLFQGISASKADYVIRKMSEINCTCSLITSDPIIKGSNGYEFVFRGKERPITKKQPNHHWSQIATQNIKVLNDYLKALVSEMPIYSSGQQMNRLDVK